MSIRDKEKVREGEREGLPAEVLAHLLKQPLCLLRNKESVPVAGIDSQRRHAPGVSSLVT